MVVRPSPRRPGIGAAAAALLCMLTASSCERIPRDPEGTLSRVVADGAFRVGVVAPGPEGSDTKHYEALLNHLTQRTRAQPRLMHGPAERLLLALEEGELDLVVGEMSTQSPWRDRVSLLPPLEAQQADGESLALTVAARNGENAWIATVFEAATMARAEVPAP